MHRWKSTIFERNVHLNMVPTFCFWESECNGELALQQTTWSEPQHVPSMMYSLPYNIYSIGTAETFWNPSTEATKPTLPIGLPASWNGLTSKNQRCAYLEDGIPGLVSGDRMGPPFIGAMKFGQLEGVFNNPILSGLMITMVINHLPLLG